MAADTTEIAGDYPAGTVLRATFDPATDEWLFEEAEAADRWPGPSTSALPPPSHARRTA